ncbi:hypothetical protein E4P29_19445 [Rhodococcus sp. 1R11]|uniref:hypothetical protein n=1 Tax=Rhodococcus sp. 1R11 TaxID=2559614 RepID=UPI001071D872|nr:hypothetical protein [Rhodococcus sp. 1R11]TFI41692.1 hypothetical protein E4P29_19445 [Rhodococcus sp. 1R11]
MLRKVLALVVILAVGAAAWHLTTPNRPIARIVPAESLACATPYPLGAHRSTPLATVPREFEPAAAITCDAFLSDRVSADKTVSFVQRRWEGDISTSIDLLNRSSEHSAWIDDCDTSTYLFAELDEFWLLDDHGRAIRPGFPQDSCGLPKPGGLAAIMDLTEVSAVEHRVPLSDNQINDYYYCSPEYTSPRAGTGRPTVAPLGSSFCKFDSGIFAGTVSADSTVDVDSLPFATDCETEATEVATTRYSTGSELGQQLTIELDGCRRVIPDGYAPLQATEELLAAFW